MSRSEFSSLATGRVRGPSVTRSQRRDRAGQCVTPRRAAQRTGHRLTNRGAALLIAASFVFFTVCTHIGLGQ